MKIDLQALGYRPQSPASKDLVDLFRYGQEEVKKFSRRTFNDRKRLVAKFIRRDIGPKFGKIIFDHFGLPYKQIYVTDDINAGPMDIMTIPNIGTDEIAINENAVTTGYGLNYGEDFEPKTWEELKTIADSLDAFTHKTNYVNTKENMNLHYSMVIPNCVFMMRDYTGDVVDELTAEELTAIYLHEIGHLIVFMERCANTVAHCRMLEEKVNFFARNADFKEKKKALEYMLKRDDKKKEPILDDVDNIDTMTTTASGNVVFNILMMFLTSVFTLLFSYFPVFFILRKTVTIFSDLLTLQLKTGYDTKKGDKLTTHSEGAADEAAADEFVSKNGMGSHLISGLDKYKKAGGMLGMDGVTVANNPISRALLFLPQLLLSIDGSLNKQRWLDIYEDDFDRTERLIRNTYDSFKDRNLPKVVTEYALKECERAIENRKKFMKNNTLDYKIRAIHQFISDYMSPLTLAKTILNGNFIKQYDRLEKKIDGLGSSKMWYQSSKIESFLKK